MFEVPFFFLKVTDTLPAILFMLREVLHKSFHCQNIDKCAQAKVTAGGWVLKIFEIEDIIRYWLENYRPHV